MRPAEGLGGAGLDRRALLARVAATAAVAGIRLSPLGLVQAIRSRAAHAGPGTVAAGSARCLSPAEWTTLAAVQETLWPAGGDAPGAAEVHATAYLDAALSEPDALPRDLVLVRAGLDSIASLSSRRGARSFEALAPAAREAVLVEWRDAGGAEWIRTVLRYTLEAVLGDPVHGGNVGEAGWRWAGFEPGEPRPKPAEGGT